MNRRDAIKAAASEPACVTTGVAVRDDDARELIRVAAMTKGDSQIDFQCYCDETRIYRLIIKRDRAQLLVIHNGEQSRVITSSKELVCGVAASLASP